MGHSKEIYTTFAVEKSAGLGKALAYYGVKALQELAPGNRSRAWFHLADNILLLKRGRIKAFMKQNRKVKHAGIKLSHAAIGTAGVIGLGLGIRAVSPSRVARTYINDANIRSRRYAQEKVKKHDTLN